MERTFAGVGVTSIPLFIEIKSEGDNLIAINDNSLSQQIEFILQDPILDSKSPPTLLSATATSTTLAPKLEYEEQLVDSRTLSAVHYLTTSTDQSHAHIPHHTSLVKIEPEEDEEEEHHSPPSMSSYTSSSSSFVDHQNTSTGLAVQTPENCTMICTTAPPAAPIIASSSSSSSSSSSASSPPVVSIISHLPRSAATAQPILQQQQQSPQPQPTAVEYQCLECPEKFDNKEIFDIHKTGHANNMKCAICNMVLKSLKNYEKHCLRCKPYECQICGRVVRFRPNFIKHMRVHTGQQSERHKYKCEVCHKEFMSFEYFKVHKKIHNDNVNLTCEICGKVFSALASLRGHSKLHSGVKLHKCEVCGKGFGQRYNLKIHARTHTGNFPYECNICNKKLHTQSSLQTHMLTHQQKEQQTMGRVSTATASRAPVISSHNSRQPKIVERRVFKQELDDDDAQMFESLPTTGEETSNESSDRNVIKNDVQNGPQGFLYAQKYNLKTLEQSELDHDHDDNDDSHSHLRNAQSSPSLATAAIIKCEPNLYSSSDNSVEMLIKKESIFDDCSAPHHNSPPTSKFHSNFDSDLVDTNDLHHSLSYSNLFEPNSIQDSIPEELYRDDDDFRMDETSLGVGLSAHASANPVHSTDGDYIKKEWVYSSNSSYSIGVHDDLHDAANFIYD